MSPLTGIYIVCPSRRSALAPASQRSTRFQNPLPINYLYWNPANWLARKILLSLPAEHLIPDSPGTCGPLPTHRGSPFWSRSPGN